MSEQDQTAPPSTPQPPTMIGSNVTPDCHIGGDRCADCPGYVEPAALRLCYHACHDDGTGNARALAPPA